MKKNIIYLLLVLLVSACGSSNTTIVITKKSNRKTTTVPKRPKTQQTVPSSALVKAIIDNANYYKGTRYKYGGTSKAGMDCSGLVYTAFKKEEVSIPRVSRAMSTSGTWIDLKMVKAGDLLFFATKKNSRDVNHVGLVTYANNGTVTFIHATTSKGVISSNLEERYWYLAFVQARRLL